MSRWRIALLLLAGGAYAGLSHWMMVWHAAEPWAVAALLGPMWLSVVGLMGGRFGKPGIAATIVLGLIGFALVLRGEAGNPDRLYVLQHAGIHAVLCCWFGGTLRADRLSLIGQFAQRIHPLSPGMREYTTLLTRIWTVYFAGMVVASIGIYALLPFDVWSVFANLFTPVSAVVLFVGEHLLRYRIHPEFERTRLIDAFRAVYAGSAADGTTGRGGA
ncbi:MAG: hypothetical protein V4636_19390 [Pseudomonadota bacterium]